MNTYYIGGIQYSANDIYHHGIKGQKWGIRRFQNEDGTLTAEGRKRYGNELGEFSNGKQGLTRRLVTGDWALGRKRIGERLEGRYERKAAEAKAKGRNEEAQNYESLRKAQRQRNIDREVYQSHTSTGKMFAQNFLMGMGADSYRVERKNQATRGQAAVAGILANLPYAGNIASAAADMYKSKKRYGHITI